MKASFLILASALLPTVSCLAEAPARVTIGSAVHRTFPTDKAGPASVYIEVSVKTTNTSQEPITFTTFLSGPNFIEHVRLSKNSKHWTDISAKGMCGLSYSSTTLAPGESVESTLLVDEQYSGKPFRLVLQITTAASDSKSGIRIKSNRIILPVVTVPTPRAKPAMEFAFPARSRTSPAGTTDHGTRMPL